MIWYKVKWITFWVTMLLWLGSFWGCASGGRDQNYRELEPQREGVRDDSETRSAPAFGLATTFITQADPADAQPAKPALPHVPAINVPGYKTDMPQADAESWPLRKHWPKIKTGPDVGVTTHVPYYYEDYKPVHPDKTIDLSVPLGNDLYATRNDEGARLEAALHNPYADNYDSHNTCRLFLQPGKFLLDTAILPVKMVANPPWKKVTTP